MLRGPRRRRDRRRQRRQRPPDHVALPARPAGGARHRMTDVDQLLAEFIAEDRAGGVADPSAYLARASDDGARAELSALLDGYLVPRAAPGVRPRRVHRLARARPGRRSRPDFVRFVGHVAVASAPAPRPRPDAAVRSGHPAGRRTRPARPRGRRSAPTTTRWSRAPCRPRASRSASWKPWAASWARAPTSCAARAKRPPRRPGPAAQAFARVASAPAAPAAAPMRARRPARDEVDELFTSG